MELSNKYNLVTYPMWKNLAESLGKDYLKSKGKSDVSVTQLIDSALSSELKRKYKAQLKIDVTDMTIANEGSVLHKAFEQAAPPEWLVEYRFFKEVDGWLLSGQADLIVPTEVDDSGCIVKCILGDYKNTSIYTLSMSLEEQWKYTNQLNVLAWLMQDPDYVEDADGNPVEWTPPQRIERHIIVGKAKDFSKAKSESTGFPAPIKELDMPIWDYADTEKYVKERIKLHKEGRKLAKENKIDHIPQCTPKEMLADPDEYAVIKEGQKNAVRNTKRDTYKEAEKVMKELQKKDPKGKYSVRTKPGLRKKCMFYCDYVNYCPYGSLADAKKEAGEALKKLMDKKQKKAKRSKKK